LVVLVCWVALAAGKTTSCFTKPPSAVIGVSEAAISQALNLIVEKDRAVL
jgi:hypothetical protein